MDTTSCIHWFSGTGNSLYAAKRISASLGGLPLVPITGRGPAGPVGGAGGAVGFVFPSYFSNLPRVMRTFVEQLEIRPDTYLFAVVTMGGAGQGSLTALGNVLKAKGLCLHYGRGLIMPANYILKYNPADPAKSGPALARADKALDGFAAEIAARVRKVRGLPLTAHNLYQNPAALDEGFFVTDACTACGLCREVCPVDNIVMEAGRPVWQHHCEHCVACISWCPTGAIAYGTVTEGRRRYRNPQITAGELTGR